MQNTSLLVRALAASAILLAAGCGDGQVAENAGDVHEHAETSHTAGEPHDHSGEMNETTHDHTGDAPAVHEHGADAGEYADEHAPETDGVDHDHDQPSESAHTTGEETGADEHDHDGTAGDWESLLDVTTVPAVRRPMEIALQVPGRVVPEPDRQAVISPFIESSVNRVFVTIGDRVDEGATLACLISPDIGVLRAEYEKAQAELGIQEKLHARRERLFDDDIISRSAYEQSQLDYRLAQVGFDYARRRLLAIGLSGDEIEGTADGQCHNGGSAIHLTTPISGVVTSRNARTGEKVDTSAELFEIIDLETVWVTADVFVRDLQKVANNAAVRIRVASHDSVFTGNVLYISDTVDETTKTVAIVAEIPNPDALLKPGMYADVAIVTGSRNDTLAIPLEAVLYEGRQPIVFVKEGESYHRHVIETGFEADGYIEVVDGLVDGAEVVTTGNFQLKSQAEMQAVDPHAGHNH